MTMNISSTAMVHSYVVYVRNHVNRLCNHDTCCGLKSIPHPAPVHISRLHLHLQVPSLTEKEPLLGLTCKILVQCHYLGDDLHDTLPTIDCDDIMMKILVEFNWQCIYGPPNHQNNYFPACLIFQLYGMLYSMQ